MTLAERVADEEARRQLHDAADYIDLHGWVQGHFFGSESCANPSACMSGALLKKMTHRSMDPLARMDASHRVNVRLRSVIGSASPTRWNDQDGRTKEEVVRALRDAADRELEA